MRRVFGEYRYSTAARGFVPQTAAAEWSNNVYGNTQIRHKAIFIRAYVYAVRIHRGNNPAGTFTKPHIAADCNYHSYVLRGGLCDLHTLCRGLYLYSRQKIADGICTRRAANR